MRLSQKEIELLATRIESHLRTNQLHIPKVSERKIAETIVSTIRTNMEQEDAIIAQAKNLMSKYDDEISSGAADERKLLQMIKSKIAKDMKFIL